MIDQPHFDVISLMTSIFFAPTRVRAHRTVRVYFCTAEHVLALGVIKVPESRDEATNRWIADENAEKKFSLRTAGFWFQEPIGA
ncbi:hypothetical protein K239x_25500 [Planctomycetes bacterium K23_9]|uniref:Uncharacterized protein n=1 Tax=Stieleria marina TaxID=1930275 RepID=A0A517NTZ9_9BACT|nr:hypothetical protein K239x_25500 [Planctomycetes bacterium K23_9]